MPRYASVFPLVSVRAVSRPFTYLADGLEKGSVVSIRFGRARRRGVVVGFEEDAPSDVEPAAVEGVLGAVPPSLVDLALWLADYYGSTPARALALVAPELPARRAGAAPRKRPSELPGEAEPERPTESQERVLARITEALGEGGTFLLYGATGSGKTEVYLRACAEALARGLDAIVLVPEIALTPQALGRFRSRFGESVAVLHSGLTEAERRDERERIAAGEARVVVGARSAVFAPVRRLGLVCVDEEQDASYKQEADPRYDARTVAAKRASLEGAVAVFGSATPRPESWERLERLEPCGRQEAAPELCPACGAAELARLGAGTERLDAELAEQLPELERFRLDADAAGSPGKLATVLERFSVSERGVLLGTQMVAKGHHFEGVALAAVVDADTALALPDFRAEERTFQLVTQLAGRSGRDAPGRVLVQTFQPDARPIQLAARHDVTRFLADELERRRELRYPPFGHLVRIVVSGPGTDPVTALSELREELAALDGVELLGPAPLLRLRGRRRAQLVAKTDQPGAFAAAAGRVL